MVSSKYRKGKMSDRRYLVANRDRRHSHYSPSRGHSVEAGFRNLSVFGVKPILLDAQSGEEIKGNGVSGVLAVQEPWPGQMRTIYGTISADDTISISTRDII